VTIDGRQYLSFCSNDYLGLATDHRLAQAATEAFALSGYGAAASRLVSGNLPEHIALENDLAALVRLPAALLFPTGYQANLGVLTALAGPDDLIVADRAVHASIIDACRLSRAKLAFYRHLDVTSAERLLARLGPSRRRRLLVTESLFSMDGDIAPLTDLSSIASTHDAALIVDEAHALGTVGPSGGGLCAMLGVRPDVLIGTLGKAFGASGAYAAGTADLRNYLINRARSFIFTTALPIPVAAAARAALHIASSPEGDRLRTHLAALASFLRSRLEMAPQDIASPILPLHLGADLAAVNASSRLLASAFFVQPIRPPTVREGTARLRITLSALHTLQETTDLANAIDALLPRKPTSSKPRPPQPSASKPIHGVVLLGTDTAVGKTTVAVALLHLLSLGGCRPVPFKPVETGADPLPVDAMDLLAASGRDDIPIRIVCPFSFPDPVAPAAAAAQNPISLSALLRHSRAAAAYGSPLVVETAGGLLSPYSSHLTQADFAAALGLPVLLIARNGLGTINQTALALAEIRRRDLLLLGLVLVTTSQTPTPDQATNSSLIGQVTGQQPLGTLPFLTSRTPNACSTALQQNVDLRSILAEIAK
jgi:8-amino-7-oxononanoate synthase